MSEQTVCQRPDPSPASRRPAPAGAGRRTGSFPAGGKPQNGGRGTTGRLHRSLKDRKIAGVCGGIAECLGVDSTIVRLAFALMVVGWGSGVLAYIICALIIPEGDDGNGDADEETEE